MLKLKTIERNTYDHLMCPYCSRMHQMKDITGTLELPARCVRCKCPFDPKDAERFIEDKATAEFDEAISSTGKKLRGEYQQDEIIALRAEVAELRRLVGHK